MAKKRTLTDVSLAKTLAVEALGSDSGYQDSLKTPLAEATDPLYRDVITLHNSLTPRQRKVLAAFARQGFIDGVSTVLGILDGSSQLGSHGLVDLDLTLRGGKKEAQWLLAGFLPGGHRAVGTLGRPAGHLADSTQSLGGSGLIQSLGPELAVSV